MSSAADYISQHAQDAKSVYVRAVAAYALTLHDSSNMMATILLDRLEKLAREKGKFHPHKQRWPPHISVMRSTWRGRGLGFILLPVSRGSLRRVCAGHPAVLRYWQETSVTADWLKPDQSSGVTVETTAYVLLTVLLKVMSFPVHCRG